MAKIKFNGLSTDGTKELHLIDLSALARSGWHTPSFARFSVTLPDGTFLKTNAMYQVLSVFKQLKSAAFNQNSNVDIVICADRRSARKQEYTDYKSDRPKMTNEYFDQTKALEELFVDSGFPLFYKDGFEADDMIKTVLVNVGERYDKIVIHTNDSDMFQLINDEKTVVKRPSKVEVNIHNFEKETKMPHNVTTLYKSIVGDGSDRIPGISGYGPVKFNTKVVQAIRSKGYDLSRISADDLEEVVLKDIFANNQEELEMSLKCLSLVKLRVASFPIPEVFDFERPNKDKFLKYMQLYKMKSIIDAVNNYV